MELYLEHHGILGQRWGVRRYQNADGSLTKAGAKRYGSSDQMGKTNKQIENRLNDVSTAIAFNKRTLRDNYNTVSHLRKKYAKDTEKNGHDPEKDIWTDKMSKRDFKRLEKAKITSKQAEKYIKEGQKEIDSILKDCGEKYIDVESKDIKRDTTRGNERIGVALAIAGAVPLGLVPGPNIAAIAAVGAYNNLKTQNSIDSTSYKINKKKETRSKDQIEKDSDNQRNANEILRYSSPKHHGDADKYIKELSDDEIKNQVRRHREARDYWNNMEGKDAYDRKENKKEARQYEKNAKRYEKELKDREWKRVDDEIKREEQRDKLIEKKRRELIKQMDLKNVEPPNSTMNKARYVNKLKDQAFDDAWDMVEKEHPELFK